MHIEYSWEMFRRMAWSLAKREESINQRLGAVLDAEFVPTLIRDQMPDSLSANYRQLLASLNGPGTYSELCMKMSSAQASELAEIIFDTHMQLPELHYQSR